MGCRIIGKSIIGKSRTGEMDGFIKHCGLPVDTSKSSKSSTPPKNIPIPTKIFRPKMVVRGVVKMSAVPSITPVSATYRKGSVLKKRMCHSLLLWKVVG